ncbi:bifunctional nuclease family protein [Caldicellulosiruptor changbaiensis]|uniref:Bifunctional nuclease family protein n=1 Tax=Caldicellulosiruptor changbaiensis TaxID=1222016 RepID=A0A3T0D2E8_9FIRM|nr:bifunctional nuclease family protein [Caldicellulosiruptor changbaiensis]AZT89368.1 bifunctional nuclease family protein [Caldicellulosiruptor changbaiensis]
MIEMYVLNVAFFQEGGGFAVLLCDKNNKMVLPIFIGPLEAQSIALALEKQQLPRPITHDLMVNIFQKFGISIQKVVITDIKDGTYYAELYLRDYNNVISVIDSRPSDAIALALRTNSPIYMAPKLIEFTYKYEELIPQ